MHVAFVEDISGQMTESNLMPNKAPFYPYPVVIDGVEKTGQHYVWLYDASHTTEIWQAPQFTVMDVIGEPVTDANGYKWFELKDDNGHDGYAKLVDTNTGLQPTSSPTWNFTCIQTSLDAPWISTPPTGYIYLPPTASVSTPTSPQSGNVTISYNLIDAESDTYSILAEYSLNGGVTWNIATSVSGQGDGTTGLESSPNGTLHTFDWDAAHDLGDGTHTNVQIRITPSDSEQGIPGYTDAFTVTVVPGEVELKTNDNGQFQLNNSDGKELLFPDYTGFLSVQIDGRDVFTNNDQFTGQLVVQSKQGNSFQYAPVDGVQITENLVVEGAALKIEVVAKNVDTINHSVKIRHLLDTQVDDNDGAPLYENGTTLIHEADFSPPNFTQWQSWRRPDDQSVMGAGTIDLTTTTRVVFAYWPSATDTNWEYTVDPTKNFYTPGETTSPDSDSCVLVYQDAGTIVPGASTTVETWYGTDAPITSDPRQALLNAIQLVQIAISRYQQGCINVISQADVAFVRKIAEDTNLKKTFEDFGEDLLTGDIARIVGKLATNSASDSAAWLATKMIPDLLVKLDETLLKNTITGIVNNWFDGPNAINPDWSDAQISEYISKYFQANTALGSILSDTSQLGADISARIPATLPASFPAQEITQSLISLANSIENIVPQAGRAGR